MEVLVMFGPVFTCLFWGPEEIAPGRRSDNEGVHCFVHINGLAHGLANVQSRAVVQFRLSHGSAKIRLNPLEGGERTFWTARGRRSHEVDAKHCVSILRHYS